MRGYDVGIRETPAPACQPIETAPVDGEFLAPNVHGDWMRVRRFDHPTRAANAVICGRIGKWWTVNVWMPFPEPPDSSGRNLADAHSKDPSRPAMPKEEDTHG